MRVNLRTPLPQWLQPLDADGYFGIDAADRPWALMSDGEWDLIETPGVYVQDLLARLRAVRRDTTDESSNRLRFFYCGAYFGPPMPPDGEAGECGWEGIVEVDDIEYPAAKCPKCGAALGREDVMW